MLDSPAAPPATRSLRSHVAALEQQRAPAGAPPPIRTRANSNSSSTSCSAIFADEQEALLQTPRGAHGEDGTAAPSASRQAAPYGWGERTDERNAQAGLRRRRANGGRAAKGPSPLDSPLLGPALGKPMQITKRSSSEGDELDRLAALRRQPSGGEFPFWGVN